MEVDTYRYLMSALIQVFGALIAVDAIFLILRYQALEKRRMDAIERFGAQHRQIYIGHPLLLNPAEFASIMGSGLAYDKLGSEDLLTLLNSAKEALDQKIKDNTIDLEEAKSKRSETIITEKKDYIGKLAESKRGIQRLSYAQQRITTEIGKVPQLVLFLMGIPAILAIVFAIFLSLSDTISSIRTVVTVFAIIFSGLGFFIIIRSAQRTFRLSE